VIQDRLGRAALRFSVAYLRRRYRREIRIGIGLAALGIGVAVYLANREVPEG
jgi:hypothetical protein